MYVSESQANIHFIYKETERGDFHSLIIQDVKVPNYQEALESLCEKQDLQREPLLTHMTRL